MFSYTVMLIDLIDLIDLVDCPYFGQHGQQPYADRLSIKPSSTPLAPALALGTNRATRVHTLGCG